MRQIPFSPPHVGEKELSAVSEALKSGWLSMGPKTAEFETEFAKYVNAREAVAVNSCTSALFLSLVVNGVRPRDEVITTPYTFAATANTIEHLGARPVFADVEPGTLNIDPGEVESKITDNTKGIVVVHYAGQPADMGEINGIAEKHGLFVNEDAAHAVGAEYEGRKIGSGRNLASFSFYATKNLTTGEGGMITLEDGEKAALLRKLRLHGMSRDAWKRYSGEGRWHYHIEHPGYKMNTTDINSALGLTQLAQIDEFNQRRAEIAERYREGLQDMDGISFLEMKNDRKTCNHLFPIFVSPEQRDGLIMSLAQAGIGASVHFIPLHIMPYYRDKYSYFEESYPVAFEAYRKEISLPIYPDLSDDDISYVIDALRKNLS